MQVSKVEIISGWIKIKMIYVRLQCQEERAEIKSDKHMYKERKIKCVIYFETISSKGYEKLDLLKIQKKYCSIDRSKQYLVVHIL